MPPITVSRIENLCKTNDMSVGALETVIGISRGTIRKWGTVNPSIDKIIKVANYFQVSSDYLLGLSDSPSIADRDTSNKIIFSLKRAKSQLTKEEQKQMNALILKGMGKLFKEDQKE